MPMTRSFGLPSSALSVGVTGTSTAVGSLGLNPAITSNSAAASSTDLDIGPMWSRLQASGKQPSFETRPCVGLRPTSPQAEDGIRMEPAVSVPRVLKLMSAATAAPDPPLEPPGTFSRSQGLPTAPKWGLLLSMPQAYSCMLSLPVRTMPASFMRATTEASSSGTKFLWIFDAIVVVSPPT